MKKKKKLKKNLPLIIDNCIQHFIELVGHECILDNDLRKSGRNCRS
jgi:hypothetical protein